MTEPQGVAPAPLAQEPLAPPPSICACGTSGVWYGWVVLACATTARCLKSFGQNNTLYLSVPGAPSQQLVAAAAACDDARARARARRDEA